MDWAADAMMAYMDTRCASIALANGVCLLGLLCGCASSTAAHDAWFGQDKALHFGYSAIIGAGGSAFARHPYRASADTAFTVGLACAIGAGVWKEWHDWRIKNSLWSWKDLFWDVLGGSAGSALGTRLR